MIPRTFLAALVLCAGALWPASADACSCAGPGSACDAVWRTDAIFVGHVVSIETTASPTLVLARRVEFAVVEAFRGVQLSQVTLAGGAGGAGCGYAFRIGESYVVYAHRTPEGQLWTSICSRTRRVAEATEDLTYLRSLRAIAPGTPARVRGRVELLEWPVRAGSAPKPAPRVAVTATGGGRTFSARADDRGEFELTGLPLGTYELRAAAPDGYESGARTLEVHDPRGCGPTVLFIRYDGRVTGRVVDARGAGVEGVPLELVPRADADRAAGRSNRAQAWTKPDGTFELGLVAPGEYVLGFDFIPGADRQRAFPRAFYPGVIEPAGARTIVMSAGERVRLSNFLVPASIPLVRVNGIVRDEAGRPVADATIALRDNTGRPNIIGPRFATGADGRFAFAVIDGGKYDVHVTRYLGTDPRTSQSQVAMARFTAAAVTPLVIVVMKPNEY